MNISIVLHASLTNVLNGFKSEGISLHVLKAIFQKINVTVQLNVSVEYGSTSRFEEMQKSYIVMRLYRTQSIQNLCVKRNV